MCSFYLCAVKWLFLLDLFKFYFSLYQPNSPKARFQTIVAYGKDNENNEKTYLLMIYDILPGDAWFLPWEVSNLLIKLMRACVHVRERERERERERDIQSKLVNKKFKGSGNSFHYNDTSLYPMLFAN